MSHLILYTYRVDGTEQKIVLYTKLYIREQKKNDLQNKIVGSHKHLDFTHEKQSFLV